MVTGNEDGKQEALAWGNVQTCLAESTHFS